VTLHSHPTRGCIPRLTLEFCVKVARAEGDKGEECDACIATARLLAFAGASMCSGSEEGSYLRLIDICITQLIATGRLLAFAGALRTL